MLETGRIGGVTGDGDVHTLPVHDGNAFADIVSAVAQNERPLTLGVCSPAQLFQLASEIIEEGFHIGEPIDPGDNLRRVLAQSVQDNPKGLFANFVGGFGNADGTLRGGKGFMTSQECKTFRLVAQKHSAKISVAKPNFAVICNRAGDTEGLESFADGFRRVRRLSVTLLDRDGRAGDVRPACIFKTDGLNAFYDTIDINALFIADCLCLFDGRDSILVQSGIDLIDSSLITFK